MAKDFFQSNDVDYEEVDVSGNQEKIQELLELTDGQMGVPVIVIDGEVVFGFDKSRIEELLGI
jgi:glutaredoxin